jgi:hypothetical protein
MNTEKRRQIEVALINGGIKPDQLNRTADHICDIIDMNYNTYTYVLCELDQWTENTKSSLFQIIKDEDEFRIILHAEDDSKLPI